MRWNKKIQENNDKLIKDLENEAARYGGYNEWYTMCREFRNQVKKKYTKRWFPWGTYQRRVDADTHGKYVDHHILSYLAPMTFKRVGWGGKRITNIEQVYQFSDKLRKKNVRFIYVPLPNKGVIYPDQLDVEEYNLGNIINSPQWRNYIYNLALKKVEIIDVWPVFLGGAQQVLLYDMLAHHISYGGAGIISTKVAEYLEGTVENISNTKIGIIGDCNLQAHFNNRKDLHSQLSSLLPCRLDNLGRQLLFEKEDGIDWNAMERVLQEDIVIYVAFASASYVRSSASWILRFGRPFSWNTLDVERI